MKTKIGAILKAFHKKGNQYVKHYRAGEVKVIMYDMG